MPLEIRELIIRAKVDESAKNTKDIEKILEQYNEHLDERLHQWKKEIIDECMEKVKMHLDKIKDR